jgi:hypothetical protein
MLVNYDINFARNNMNVGNYLHILLPPYGKNGLESPYDVLKISLELYIHYFSSKPPFLAQQLQSIRRYLKHLIAKFEM